MVGTPGKIWICQQNIPEKIDVNFPDGDRNDEWNGFDRASKK